nr:hypothetical protein BaRGS_029500 [Batillaria attramentaria]
MLRKLQILLKEQLFILRNTKSSVIRAKLRAGARVFGTAGTDEGMELVKQCGAQATFNHRQQGYADKIKAATGGGVDVVIEMATGINLQRDLDLIAMRGRIVLVGAGPETTISPLSVLVKEARILGINMFETTEADWREMTAFFEAGMETGWVLLKASAVGINTVDWYIASGNFPIKPPLPWIPGWDAAGVVEAVGKKVTKFKKGDRVYCAGSVSGSYAEYVVSEERQTGHLGKLSFAQGAAIGVPYNTAYRAVVHKAKVRAGETVLIHGASGAVGNAGVQLCKALGARVFGTAGTDKGLDLVKANGAVATFNHREKGYEDKIKAASDGGVDVVIEMAGNVNLQRDLDLVAKRGRIVIVGGVGDITINAGSFLMSETTVQGITLYEAGEADWREMTAFYEAGIETGWVKPVVAKEYPLAQVGQALKDMQEKSATLGNFVMTV